ncbi:hypothetical protein TSOC_005205 [Tetrabaena socialis]|uniref:Uncharacterized protein n=1 Tax=Tetrabaena socialis TaxID=47790 RepID=A0A2J8A6U5_9CHLO|nr:hypothetical protein TSOC_005205 [Tetrabaena socialis]|eukprot:PNH08225.1 hypothetical protein TSOC_005205 [Tetrabaena socialis]
MPHWEPLLDAVQNPDAVLAAAGICDDDNSMCYCPPETKFGRREAPAGSPPGSPPLQRGRPMYWCQPSSDKEGNKVMWGAVKYEDLYGDNGWCNADVPNFMCPCRWGRGAGGWVSADQLDKKPWLKPAITPPVAAEDPPTSSPQRKRPYIYVYDVKPDYSTDMLQYRIERSHCNYRQFEHANASQWIGYNAYALESVLHEIFLSSEHRTFE